MAYRWTRLLLIFAGGVVGLVAALAVFINTDIGRRTIAALVGPLSGGRVAVEGLSGRLPHSLRAQHVELRDDSGAWLVIDNAELDWSPFALIRNRVNIGRFAAERVQVLRLPDEDDEESDTQFAVDVGDLRIGRLETSADVSRTPASVEVQGSARYTSLEEWAADLTANRLEGSGLYRLRASYDDGLLSGAADIEEPPAGLVAGLLGLNDIGAIEAHATGSGPREANAIELTLAAGPMRASGRGTINLIARTADMAFSAEAPEMTLRPDLAWQSLTAEGQLRGSFDAPDVTAELDVRTLRVQGVSAEGVTANVEGQTGMLDFRGSLSGLRLPGPEPDLFARAPVSASGRIALQTPERSFTASLSHPLLGVEAQGTAGDAKRVQTSISVPRLAPFAERSGVDLDGRATLTALIDQVGDDFRVAANGTVNAARGEGPLPQLIGGNARVAINATVNGSDIALSDARLEGSAANIQVSGRVRDNDIELDWRFGLSDLSLLADQLVGDLSAQGQAQGPWRTARVQATAVANVGTPAIQRQQINISLNAIGLPRPESGTFSAQGRFDDAPLSLEGELAREEGGLRATIERGAWKSLDARADVSIPDAGDVSGTATWRLARLGDIATLIGEPIAGSVQGDVELRLRDGDTSAEITARAQDIEYANTNVESIEGDANFAMRGDVSSVRIEARANEISAEDATIGTATINGRIDNPFDGPSLALAVDAARLTAASFSGGAKAQIDGPTDAIGIRLEWTPRDSEGNAAEISTAARLDLPQQRLLFSTLELNYRGETATLEQPFTLAFGAETSVDRVLLRVAEGQVSASGTISPRLELRATAQNISATKLTPFLPQLSSEGTFSATADLSGTLAAPEGTISVQGKGLRPSRFSAGVMPASLDAKAVLRERTLTLNADISSGPSLKMTVSGDVSLDAAHALDLDVQGQGELSFLNAMLSAEGRSLQGQMALNLSVGGTVSAPRLSGRATLANGEIQDVQHSLRIRDIAMTAEGAGEQLRISQFSGRAGDGTITGTGTIDLTEADLPVSFMVTAQNARPIVSDRFAATADANLRVTGAVRGQLGVAGTVDVTRAEITLPGRVPPTVVVLDVRRPGDVPAVDARAPAAYFADIRYDLTISTRGQVFVRGRGIEAELDGTTQIRGTTAAPQITGGFDLQRGTFTFASRTLMLTSGRVAFDGASIRNRIDPTLDLAAETTSAGITARLAVTGYASAPRIELSSTPTMPADEILARMLFQRSAAQLSPAQLLQLAELAVSLTSGGSGFDPLGSLRRSLGLSRLSIGSTGGTTPGPATAGQARPGTTVEAGTYVLRNVYVGARQGLEGGTQAEVQVDITNRLRLVGTVNSGANAAVTQGSKQRESGSSIGLSYEFEY